MRPGIDDSVEYAETATTEHEPVAAIA
jgi:hypothetical protein